MPTPLTHAAVGYALGTWLHPRRPDARVSLAAAACAALPDLDAIGWVEHIPDTSVFAHRAITHSLLVAVLAALVATALLFRRQPWARDRARIAVTLGVALLSHSCLDALSTYSLGIEFFAPFSSHRFRFPWTPLGNPHWSLFAQLAQEVVLVLLPALFAAWLGFRVRPGRKLAQPCSGLTGG